jgi:hypothetical protein
MAVAYNPTPIDWSALNNIGANIGQGMQNRRLRGAIGPNGEIDFKALWEADPITALKYKIAQDEAEALGAYRTATINERAAPTLDEKIYNDWRQSQQPSYLGPQEDTTEAAVAAEEAEASAPTGVPGTSYTRPSGLENAPKLVQDKLMSNRELARQKQIGEGEGNRASSAQAMVDLAPSVQAIINQAVSDISATDPDTFANALGPLQGADDPNTWQEAIGTRGAQTFGSLVNYMQHTQGQGVEGLLKPVDELPGGLTSTVRDNVKSMQATIINQIRKVQRVVGEGSQSDRELQQIVDQAGKLQNSRTIPDYMERLSALVTRLNDIGIPLKMPTPEEISGLPPTSKSAEQFRSPEPAQATAPTAPAAPVQGSMAPTQPLVPGATQDPAGAYFSAPTGSGSAAIQNIKRAVAEGKMTRKQAIAIINANKDKWGVEVDESR